MKRAAIYARVSTGAQSTAMQIDQLREVADRSGWEVVTEFVDAGLSGAKGRDGRPAFDEMCMGAVRREYDIIMAWCYGNPDYDKKRVTAAEVQATKMLKAKVTAREADDQIAKMRNMLKEDLYPMLRTGWYMAEETSESPFEGRVNDLPVTLKYKNETNVLGHIEKKTINAETGEL